MMMSMRSTMFWLWLFIFSHTIAKAEQLESSHESQHSVNEKCHVYMSPIQCTGWLHDYVTNQSVAVDNALNKVKDNIQNTDRQLHQIHSIFDDKYRNINTRIDEAEEQFISKMDEQESDLKEFLLDIDDKHSIMDKNVSKLWETLGKAQADIHTHDGRLDRLSNAASEQTKGLDDKLDTGLKNLRDDLNQEAEKWRKDLNELSLSITDHDKRLDDVISDVASNKKDLAERIELMDGKLNSQVTNLKAIINGFRSDMVRELGSRIDQVQDEMDKETSMLKRIFEQSTTDHDNKFQDIRHQITELHQKMDQVASNLENKIERDIKTIKDELDGKIIQLKVQVNKVEETMNTGLGDLKTELSKLTSDFLRHKTEVKSDINTVSEKLVDQVNAVNNRVDTVQSKIDHDLTDLREEVDDKIREEIHDLFTKIKALNQTVDKQNSTLQTVYENAFHRDGLIMVIMVLFVFLVINYFIVYIIVKRTKPAHVSPANAMFRSLNIKEPRSPTEVRNWFASSISLKNAVCIISFSEASQEQHKQLMIQTVYKNLPAAYHDKVLYHVIRREEDIANIPLAKLCLLFVEFTERHVIIEEPGLGLGDLKRKTHRYITDSGACIAIIYVKDPESRKIPDKTLYNRSIHCVSSQKELIALRDDQRFISVYKDFTSFQLQRLVELIKENVK